MSIRFRSRTRTVMSLVLFSVAAAACSGGGSSLPAGSGVAPVAPADSPSTVAASTSPGSSVAGASGVVIGHVGDSLTLTELGGDKVDITLVKVFDPATVADVNNAAPAGARWVGLEITTNNHSSAIAEQSEVVDGMASDGETLTTEAVFQNSAHQIGAFKECTNPTGPAQTDHPYTSCAAFLVPTGVTVTSVSARVGGTEIYTTATADQATWKVP